MERSVTDGLQFCACFETANEMVSQTKVQILLTLDNSKL